MLEYLYSLFSDVIDCDKVCCETLDTFDRTTCHIFCNWGAAYWNLYTQQYDLGCPPKENGKNNLSGLNSGILVLIEHIVITTAFLFKWLFIFYHRALIIQQNQENACEDTEEWCFVLEEHCEDIEIQGKCPKTCNQCNGKHKVTN